MENGELQTTGRRFALYLGFAGNLSAVKVHKHFMKPSGEKIDHWTAFIYDLGDHFYHLLHASSDIFIQIVLFGLFFRLSWKIVSSELKRSDSSQLSEFSDPTD